jgi:hypothetical protein
MAINRSSRPTADGGGIDEDVFVREIIFINFAICAYQIAASIDSRP